MCTVHDDKPELGRLPLVREVLKAPLPSSPTPSTVSSSPRTLPWPLPAWPLGWQFVGFPACLGGAALSTWLAIRRFSGLLGVQRSETGLPVSPTDATTLIGTGDWGRSSLACPK